MCRGDLHSSPVTLGGAGIAAPRLAVNSASSFLQAEYFLLHYIFKVPVPLLGWGEQSSFNFPEAIIE